MNPQKPPEISRTADLTLTEFLLARIAEDEQMARSAQATASLYDPALVRWHWLRTNGHSSAWEPTSHDPARVLAECEAKRRIVAEAEICDEAPRGGWCYGCDVALRAHAAVYSDHSDYRHEWRP